MKKLYSLFMVLLLTTMLSFNVSANPKIDSFNVNTINDNIQNQDKFMGQNTTPQSNLNNVEVDSQNNKDDLKELQDNSKQVQDNLNSETFGLSKSQIKFFENQGKDITNIVDKKINVVTKDVKDLIQKRVISYEKLNQIRNDYKNAIENYNNLKKNFDDQKELIKELVKEEKKCEDDCSQLNEQKLNATKEYLNSYTLTIKETINRIQNKLLENQGINQNDLNSFLELNQNKLNEIEKFQTQIQNTDDTNKLNNLGKEISNYWNQNKNTFKEQIKENNVVELNAVIIRMNVLENKIEILQNKILEQNTEISAELTDAINKFSNLILEAKEIYQQDEYDLNQINEKLKDANYLLIREILPLVKQYLTEDEIETTLKINDDDKMNIVEI